MLEEKLTHPVKRMWNSDADESVETSKRLVCCVRFLKRFLLLNKNGQVLAGVGHFQLLYQIILNC